MKLSAVHLMGATVLRARIDDTSRPDLVALDAAVRPHLTADALVVLELASDPVEIPGIRETLIVLQAVARTTACRLVVVERDTLARDQLRAAGITDVHDSLDTALGDEAPVLRDAVPHGPLPGLAPSAADATVVAAEDLDSL